MLRGLIWIFKAHSNRNGASNYLTVHCDDNGSVGGPPLELETV
jgi:hypothetical protein